MALPNTIQFDAEAIEAALFALIKQATSSIQWATIERHARIWGNLTGIQQPALFLVPNGFRPSEEQVYSLHRIECHFTVLIYTRADATPDSAHPPQQILNKAFNFILQALWNGGQPCKLALVDPNTGAITAGPPSVVNAFLDGEAPMQPGVLDEQCGHQIPIKVIAGV